MEKGKSVDRDSLSLYHVYKDKKRNERNPLVLTYDRKLDNEITRKHMNFLHEDEKLCKIFPDPPLISFRRNRNLRDLLVNARLPSIPDSDEQPGFCECPSKKCSVMNFAIFGDKFSSSVTKQSFPINSFIHDKMDWLIYLITCKRCNMQYVGQTKTTLYTRFTNHKSDIKLHTTEKSKQLPIGKHFNSGDHSFEDISIMAIESITKKEKDVINKRESFWVKKLRTLAPSGINEVE